MSTLCEKGKRNRKGKIIRYTSKQNKIIKKIRNKKRRQYKDIPSI